MRASPIAVVSRPESTFCRVGDGSYQLTILSLGIQFTVDRLRRERHELIGELRVACDEAGARTVDGFISVADFNLSSAQARKTRASLLAGRSAGPEIDWELHIEELCVRTIAAEREGVPSRLLETFERADPEAVYDVDGWPWLQDQPMMTFADGGALKSYLALYGAGVLSRRGVRVGYADWELSGHEHRDRLERLFGPNLPPIHYFRCDRPLVDEADHIRREVRRLGLDYMVFDSAGFGTAGAPEAAEHALGYFRAVRQIGVGSHHLAHVNRSDTGDQKPFGSTFWHNSARSTWFAKQSGASPDGQRLTVGLFNRKSNLTKRHSAIGFQFDFDGTRTVVTRVNLADIEDLAGELPLWQRIQHLLKSGGGLPLTIEEIAEALAAKVNSVMKAVERKGSVFTRVERDGVTRIALVDQRLG